MQRERDTAYGLTLVWALVAVYGQQQSRAVRIAALVCVALNMLLAIVSLLRCARTRRSCVFWCWVLLSNNIRLLLLLVVTVWLICACKAAVHRSSAPVRCGAGT